MSMQADFRTFHERIQLARFDENAILRDKRDRVLTRLRQGCARPFTHFNQGSYEMGTGVIPLDGDYDIDVGVVFELDPGTSPPLDAKRWVFQAVFGHTQEVIWKTPCITVQYQVAGEAAYHVDLAVYGKDRAGRHHLARGRQHAAPPEVQWQPSEAQELTRIIGAKFTGEDDFQFRRTIRYLKRWRDQHFSTEGNAAPRGIGLTALAYQWFVPVKTAWSASYDDLSALRSLTGTIAASFRTTWSATGSTQRIEARIPAAPHDDVLARMSDQQMVEFKGRIEDLRRLLDEAAARSSTSPLRKAFGTDFPQ